MSPRELESIRLGLAFSFHVCEIVSQFGAPFGRYLSHLRKSDLSADFETDSCANTMRHCSSDRPRGRPFNRGRHSERLVFSPNGTFVCNVEIDHNGRN